MKPGIEAVRIRVLGPIEILTTYGRTVQVRGGHQLALLAMLTSEHGRLIPASRLIEALWADRPPISARTKLQGHISAIRKIFDGPSGWPILTCSPGYLLDTRGVSLDLAEYRMLRQVASHELSDGQYATASEHLTEALALWRGPAFAGASPSFVLTAMSEALEQDRLLAIERKAVCDLRLEHYDEVTAELALALATHPLRETMRAALMLAMYRRGCRAEALRAYRQGYSLSREIVGIGPGKKLEALHQLMLGDDPILATVAAIDMLPGAGPPCADPVEPLVTHDGARKYPQVGSAELAELAARTLKSAG